MKTVVIGELAEVGNGFGQAEFGSFQRLGLGLGSAARH
jgi:hypothetical protein